MGGNALPSPAGAGVSSFFSSSFSALSSAFFSFFSSTFSSSFSFLPRKPPKREERFPRETDRLLLLADFFFFSSSEELDEDPVRAGAAVSSVAAEASPSAGLGVASVLFLGVVAAAAASVAGLPSRGVSALHGREQANAMFYFATRRDAQGNSEINLPSFSSCSL